MDINEIIKRHEVDVDEMTFVINAYIKERKDKNVNIYIRNIHPIISASDINKLARAYEWARMYYINKQDGK